VKSKPELQLITDIIVINTTILNNVITGNQNAQSLLGTDDHNNDHLFNAGVA